MTEHRPEADRDVSALGARREAALVFLGFSVLTVLFTYPLAFNPTALTYRINNGDSQWSVWVVSWVAHALTTDPLHVLDANIFHPHRFTLSYSEMNLGAGALAVPVYWVTGSAFAAHNSALLLSFVLSGCGTYYLARYLSADRRAAAIAGIMFAFAPHLFGHLPHINLLMTAGIPFSMLALHRLADRPSPGRGAALGGAMGVQALFCGYYAVFVMLLVGYATLVMAASRRDWTNGRYWSAIAVAAVTALAVTGPLLVPYAMLDPDTGFSRSAEAAREFSADWRAYLASSSYAHRWMLAFAGKWTDVLFPGFLALGLGAAGIVVGWRSGGRRRETVALYGSIAALAAWISLGPGGGLYRVLHATVPAFNFLRAPSRFGVLVAFALSVLAAMALSRLFGRLSKPGIAAAGVGAAVVAELLLPIPYSPVPPTEPVYQLLATLPRGAVIELPVYSRRNAWVRAQYMLSSTAHWMPLVVAYSDYMPRDFLESVEVLANFPTRESLERLDRDSVRYAVFHVDRYGAARDALVERLAEFAPRLRQLYADERTWLYEIISNPQ